MLKNFFLATLRNLRKNVLYTFINISGLAIGIACSILILLWVHDESTYDNFVPKSERLYQVWVNATFDGKVNSWMSVPLPSYEALKTANSAIVNTTVAGWGADRLLTFGEKRIIQQGYYVGEEFLDMFEYEVVAGDRDTALDEINSIAITQKLAATLFGDEDAMGKIIKVSNQYSMKVTAILKDLPGNSSFEFEFLMPWTHRRKNNSWVERNHTNWGNYSFQVYVELDDPSKELPVEAAIAPMLSENGEDDLPRAFFLHPMTRWRLHSQFEDGKEAGGRAEYVQLFSFIAIFILIIACINFMNLATARSEKRAKEVGIRKSLGSTRINLILQFLGESIVISAISFTLALILAGVALPFYNDMVDKQLVIDFQSGIFWTFASVLVFGTGIVSGSYPALFLSSFNPVITLKGTVKVGKGASLPRKVLVIFQFAISILLMVATIVIYQQISLVKSRELGYDQERLISVQLNDELTDKYEVIKNELEATSAVVSVTKSNSQITQVNSNNFLSWPGKPEDLKVMFVTIAGHYDWARTMGVKVLEGRDFSKEFGTDTSAIVVNKAAIELMNLPEPVIGTNLDLWGDKRKLIGVVDNVLMGSPYEEVRPMFLFLDHWGGYISLRISKEGELKDNLAAIESVFTRHNPAYPFEYKFADVEFQRKFNLINLTQKLATLFALLAVFITGLGLFGLASFMAEQRTKEIGIRKVLGATVSSLILLISKDFTKLVALSFVIIAPLAWYALDNYLEKYTIRVDVNWWIFPFVGFVALGFALLIVSNQAGRAARANPVKSLRQE